MNSRAARRRRKRAVEAVNLPVAPMVGESREIAVTDEKWGSVL